MSSSGKEIVESLVGKTISHESASLHVTGRAKYTDDLVDRFAGLLHAWPVQATVACGRVESVDDGEALKVPGVLCVLRKEDARGTANVGPAKLDEPIFPERIVYHGQPITWVIAETEEAAIEGASKVSVEVTPEHAVLSIEQAIEEQAFHGEALVIESGNVDEELRRAKARVSGELHVGGQEHFYLETQASIAHRNENDELVVHASTQHPSETQEIVARVLGLPKHEVVCQSIRMGGAFGGKEVQANLFAAIAAVAAEKTGRPVRVRLDRLRDFTITGKRHPFLGRYQVGFEADGRITALSVELFSDGGFSLDLSKPVLQRAMFHADGSYRIDSLRVTGRICRTNTTSHTAFRGFGGPQGMVVTEDAIAAVAKATGLDPHVVRERNFYAEGDRTHYGQLVKDAERVRRTWDRVKEKAEFERRLQEIKAFNESHHSSKRGIAITPVKFGISFTADFYNQAGALVIVYKDGSVQLNHGGTEMGQGLHTKMRQVAAHALGIPLENVRVMATRTDKVPNTSATAASSGSDLNGAAVKAACDKLRARLASVAARALGESPDDLLFSQGKVSHFAKLNRSIPFADVVKKAYFERVQLFEAGYYRTPHIFFDEQAGRGKPFHYFAYGAAITEVQVDAFTGQYVTVRTDIVHDVGDSISPLVDLGQVEGGFVQGLGWLTQEELVWDDKGQLRTGNASTYKLPSLGECPPEFNVELLERATESSVVYGSKAVGEPPFMLAISVREALRQAVGGGRLGCPATPEAVYWALGPDDTSCLYRGWRREG